jgi:hypothetical protein
MPNVVASINLPVSLWEKCQRYKLNRSAIARTAIALEIDRIENKEAQMTAQAEKPILQMPTIPLEKSEGCEIHSDSVESDIYWCIGRIERAIIDNRCIASELDGVLPRLREVGKYIKEKSGEKP